MISRQATWPLTPRQGVEQPLLPPFQDSGPEIQFRRSVPRSQTRTQTRTLWPDSQHLAPVAATPPQDVTSEAVAIWRGHIGNLSQDERNKFLKYSHADLKQYVVAIEKTVQEQGRNSRAIRIARLIRPLFQTMNMYAPIAQTMIQADPSPSALVLGGITCIMSISSRFVDYQEKVAKTLSEMLEKLEILLQYGASVYRNNAPVQTALVEVYGDILQFCIEASRFFLDDKGNPRSSLRALVSSLWQPFESKFSDILYKFDRHLNAFEERARLVDRERMESGRAMQFQLMRNQIFEGYQNQRDVVSIGYQMLDVASRRQQEEVENRIREIRKMREKKRREVIAWLPSISFQKDQEEKYTKRLEGTGQWLLDNEIFQRWRTKSASELLWVHGKHSCGKSHLAARVIHELSETNQQTRDSGSRTALAYIYCSSIYETQFNPSKLVGSILSQLCHSLPKFEIEESLENIFDRQSEAPTKQEPGKQDMQKAIISIMAKFSQTFIVVDGLDECHKLPEDQFEELCDFVKSLVQPKAMNYVAKVLVFSRPEYLEIRNAFGDCPQIQVDAGANDDDIKQFIAKKVSGKDIHVRFFQGLSEEVEGTLLSGAEGMFIWVDLLVKTLRKQRTKGAIRAKLKQPPKGLDELYEMSMKRILEQDTSVSTRALKILLWTMNAKRALAQRELLEALAIQPGITELDDEDIIHDDIGFAAECGDLVVLSNGYYHLLHSSLKDYLEKLPTSGSNLLEEYGLMQKDAARILGETCLTYLNFDRFKEGPIDNDEDFAKLQDEYPFLHYAANYWGNHVADTNGLDLLDLTKTFIYSNASRELSMQFYLQEQGSKAYASPGTTTPLHILSIFNLVKIAKELEDADEMKSLADNAGNLPLEYAFVVGSKEMSMWLLENTNGPPVATDSFFSPLERLHRAAIHDWDDVVQRLLDLGYDREGTAGERQQTALHFAAFEGSESALKTLLKARVNLNPVDTCQQTPLLEAAESNHPRMVELLLEAGADLNIHGWNGATALHHAVKYGDLGTAKELLRRGAEVDPICTSGWGFRTPLHLAAEHNFSEVLELLINNGANIERTGPDNFNALLLACSNGSSACLELLLKAGARTDPRDDKERTCFHVAAQNGHSDILKILFDKGLGEDLINSGDSEGDTPLHIAVSFGKKSEARLLLENGALADKKNKSRDTVLHVAIMDGQTELGKLLLESYGADVKLRGWEGYSALHYAADNGCQDFIPLLLSAGADPNALDDVSETPLHLAARNNKIDFVKILLEAAPTLDPAHKNKSGRTPLLDAASEGNNEVVKLLLNDDNVNLQGSLGQTALIIASALGHLELVKYLLANGANPDQVDDSQNSPLFVAIANKYDDIAAALLDVRANPKLVNKSGDTALHPAAHTSSMEIVARLLDAGCDMLHASMFGITPFMNAVLSGRMDVVKMFLDHGCDDWATHDVSGRRCIHIAAGAGSVQVLNMVIAKEKEFAKTTDCIGHDALDYAASTGQVDMIRPLRDLGLGASGLDEGSRRPLKAAVADGFYDFACRMIDLGADVNKQKGTEKWGPLHAATAYGRPRITERLMRAGADPTLRDAFGLSSLDYAIRNPQVWEKMGDARAHYTPIELRTRMPALRETVRQCIQNITTQTEYLNLECQYVRLDNVSTLGLALIAMGSDASRELSKMCWIELATPPETWYFRYIWDCEICAQKIYRGTRYVCLECHACGLCSMCYKEYLTGDETAKSAPQSVKTLQKLEDEIRPSRERWKSYLSLGGSVLYAYSLTYNNWVNEKLKAYEDWEKTHNDTGQFKSYQRPGQEFLKLVQKLREIGEKSGESQRTGENPFSAIVVEFADFYREHKPDKEVKKFVCSNHEYMEIPTMSEIEDAGKACFDADGKLTTDWMLDLLEIYKDGEMEAEASEHPEEARFPESEPSTERASSQRELFESSLWESLLAEALTDEPLDIGAGGGTTENPGAQK